MNTNHHEEQNTNGGFIQSPAAELRRRARTGSRTPRRNALEGKSANPSSPGCSCRNACPRRGGRRGSPPPILPAPIQPRLWDWRRGTGDSGPPEGDILDGHFSAFRTGQTAQSTFNHVICNLLKRDTRFDSHLLNHRSYVVHIQRHIVFQVQRTLGNRDAEPVRRQSRFVFIVPTPDYYGRMRLEALNLISKRRDNTESVQDRKMCFDLTDFG